METFLQLIWLILLFLLCFYLWIHETTKAIQVNLKLIKHSIRTKGKIVKYTTKKNEDGSTLYHPIIEFYEISGKKNFFESKSGSTERLRLGKQILIYYDEANPEKLLKGSSDLIFEFVKLIFGISGCGMVTIYLLVWW